MASGVFPAEAGIPPQPDPVDAAGPVLNLAFLSRQFQRQRPVLDLLIQDFAALAVDLSSQLAHAIEQQDYAAYRDGLHELYAAAGTVGATRLETLCQHASAIPPSQLAERKAALSAGFARVIGMTRAALACYEHTDAPPPEAVPPADDTPPTGPARESRKTLLLVDDNPLIRRHVRAIVEGEFDLIDVTTGTAALRQCEAVPPPDLVILDLKLTLRQEEGDPCESRLSGLEVAHRLPPTQPFIVLTGDRSRASRHAAIAAGAWGYCIKPLDPDQLLAALDVALMRAEVHRQHEQAGAIHYAAGVLGALNQLDQVEAHQHLRRLASTRRQKLADAAQAIIEANAARILLYHQP